MMVLNTWWIQTEECQSRFKTIAEQAIQSQSSKPINQVEFENAVKEYITNLFRGLHNMYDNEGVLNKAILNEFEIAFIIKYLNYEMGYENPNVFSQKLYGEVMKYSDYLFKISDEYKDMFEAAVQVYNKTIKNRTYEESGNNDKIIDNSVSTAINNTISDSTNTSGTVENTQDNTLNGTNTQTGTVDTNNTSTSDSTGRTITSDYPQSTVDLNMSFPLNNNFTYASDGSDNLSHGSVVTDNLVTNNLTSGSNTTSKVIDSGTSKSEGTREATQSQSSNTIGNTSDKENYDKNSTENEDVSLEIDTVSPLERTRILMELVEKYKYSPIYKVLENIEKLFISSFIDEERYYYVSPSFIENWYKGVE